MAGMRMVAVVKPVSRIAILLQRIALDGPTVFSACAALERVRERKSAAQKRSISGAFAIWLWLRRTSIQARYQR